MKSLTRRTSLLLLITLLGQASADEYQWTNVTMKAKFARRDGAGALVYRGRMFLIGGWNPIDRKIFPRICSNDVWSSVDGKTWVELKPNSFRDRKFNKTKDWEGRHTAGYVVHRNKMWIIGGDVNQGYYQHDVWNSSDGKHWTRVTAKVPWGPRALHYTLAFKGYIWVMGGQTLPQFGKTKEVFYRDVWRTKDGKKWEKLTPQEPYWSTRGMIGGNVVFKNRMWMLGGGTYDTPKNPNRKFYNDVWSSANGVNWKQHAAKTPWTPRQYHEVAVYDNKMWVMEGYNKKSGNRRDVWYSADGKTWQEVPKTPWKPRHAASVFVYKNALWMVAGNNMESDVWKLTRKK